MTAFCPIHHCFTQDLKRQNHAHHPLNAFITGLRGSCWPFGCTQNSPDPHPTHLRSTDSKGPAAVVAHRLHKLTPLASGAPMGDRDYRNQPARRSSSRVPGAAELMDDGKKASEARRASSCVTEDVGMSGTKSRSRNLC